MPEAPLWTKHFILVSLANFFMFSTFYALLVTLPSIAVEVYGVSESIAGLYTTLFLLAAIFIRFFIGTLMKFATERILYISSYVIFTFASFIYLLSDHYLFVLGIRFIHGLG